MGTLTTPTKANMADALSARLGSSMEARSAIYPIYKNSKISSEVRRASQTHQAPQVGRPQNAPVHKAMNVMSAPVGASACASIDDKRVFMMRPTAAQKDMMR